jgi:diacylglycerol kinase (ATP)
MPHRGRAAYLRATLAAVWSYRPAGCRLIVDDERWHDGAVLLVAVANGETFGRGMRIAPGARLDDGLANVVLVRPVPRWQLPARLPQIYRGTHVRTRYVRTGRGARVRLEPAPGFPPFDLDGETFPAAPCDITVLAGALRVVC